MAVIPFPEPDQPKSLPQNSILGIDPTQILAPLIDAFGDMTVGEALEELAKMPMKDMLRDLFGIGGE